MRRRWFLPLQPELSESIAGNETPPDVAADVSALRTALGQLPARQREAITLFELAGLSLQEVQQVQGGSLSGVKSRIVRGRRRLAELLGATTQELTNNQQSGIVATSSLLPSMQPSRTHE